MTEDRGRLVLQLLETISVDYSKVHVTGLKIAAATNTERRRQHIIQRYSHSVHTVLSQNRLIVNGTAHTTSSHICRSETTGQRCSPQSVYDIV